MLLLFDCNEFCYLGEASCLSIIKDIIASGISARVEVTQTTSSSVFAILETVSGLIFRGESISGLGFG